MEEYLDEFNHDLARRFCERALQMAPDNVRALETSGAVLLEMDDIENAKQVRAWAVSYKVQSPEGNKPLLSGMEGLVDFTDLCAMWTKWSLWFQSGRKQ